MSARVTDLRVAGPASPWFWVRWAIGGLFSVLGVVIVAISLVGIPLALYLHLGLHWFWAIPLWLVTPLFGWLLLRLGRVMRGLTAKGLSRNAGPRPWQPVREAPLRPEAGVGGAPVP